MPTMKSDPWFLKQALGHEEQFQAGQAGGRFAGSRDTMGEGLGYYRDMIEGEGPSVAEEQMRAGSEANIRGQIQAQATGRGGNMAATQQIAAGQAAGQGMEMNQQAAALRAQEQQAAMAGFSGVAGQMAGMDLEQQLGMAGIGMEGKLGELGAFVDYEGIRQKELEDRRRMGLDIAGMAFGAIGSGMSMSDVRAKENIVPLDEATAMRGGAQGLGIDSAADRIAMRTHRPETGLDIIEAANAQGLADRDPFAGYDRGDVGTADPFAGDRSRFVSRVGGGPNPLQAEQDAAEALGRVGAYEFDYKPGMGPGGRQVGPMAQDLAAEPALAGMVVPTEQGLGVDTAAAGRTALAATSNHERRMQELEDEQAERDRMIAEVIKPNRLRESEGGGAGGGKSGVGGEIASMLGGM